MSQESLGLIETIGLTTAIAAADAAVKSANVTLVGYELTNGDGMTVVKLRGDVGAVKAAISAAEAAAGCVGRVIATRVIARPADEIARIVDSRETVGLEPPVASVAAPEVLPPAEDEPAVEPLPTPDAVVLEPSETPAEASAADEMEVSVVEEPLPVSVADEAVDPAEMPATLPQSRADRRHRRR